MRAVTYISLAAAVLSVVVSSPARIHSVHAQGVVPPTCAGTASASPSPGRYTGSWHSDGDYHFAVFNTDLDLKIIIDGTLDFTVGADGQVSGTASGNVNAPIYHDGIHDVSSGTGTISGIVSGTASTSSSSLVLAAPVIAMQWGTFIAGGYTVPRSITMPNYQFPLSTIDCVSFGGSIAEQNFPVQYVVADGASGLTQAPGIGGATGSWSITDVDSPAFDSLSQNIAGFISTANAALAQDNPITPAEAQSAIVQPLTALLQSIAAHPDLSNCLLRQVNAWISGVAPSLYTRVVQSLGPGDPPAFRQAFDLLRLAQAMQQSCSVADGGAASALSAAETTALDRSIAQRQWAVAAQMEREIELDTSDGSTLATHTFADFSALVRSAVPATDLVDVARMAYAWGDESDARAALAEIHPGTTFTPYRATTAAKKHKKKKEEGGFPDREADANPFTCSHTHAASDGERLDDAESGSRVGERTGQRRSHSDLRLGPGCGGDAVCRRGNRKPTIDILVVVGYGHVDSVRRHRSSRRHRVRW